MSFFTGTQGRYRQLPTIEKGQQPLKNQLFAASRGGGGGGAFGDAGDYYRSLLEEDNPTFNSMAAPEMRRFNEQIIPDLAEQFAGMGSGGLSSSGFRNAGVNAGTDLAERLGAIRAQLRQQGAAGLMGIGQQALNPFVQNIYEAPQPGFLESIAPLAGAAVGAVGGPIGSSIGSAAGNWLSSKFGNSSPAGGGNRQTGRGEIANWKGPASPNINFMGRTPWSR